MKYTNEHEETAVWISLSAAWMLGGILAWSLAVFSAPNLPADGGTLTILAIAISAISCILRLPVLTRESQQENLAKHTAWLFGFAANMNWFGFLCLRSESLAETIPSAFIFVVVEILLCQRTARGDCLPWARESFQRAGQSMGALLAPSGENGADKTQALSSPTADLSPAMTSSASDVFSEGVERRCTDGVDDEGQRYISGEILVRLEIDQSTETVVVGFCPPFANTPTVELEITTAAACEAVSDDPDYDIEARVVTCSPMGMRILVKRVPARGATELLLGWFAVEASQDANWVAGPSGGQETPQTLP